MRRAPSLRVKAQYAIVTMAYPCKDEDWEADGKSQARAGNLSDAWLPASESVT
jgi:hypothetical protein